MNYTLQPLQLTKELILSRVSEESIMEHYLGVPVKKGLFCSPLRSDKHPTCTFYRSPKTGELIYKDFGSDHRGNCFSVVMYKFNCSYGKALGIIANDFNIVKQPKLQLNPPKIKYTGNKLQTTLDSIVTVELKPFEEYELEW